MAIKAVLFDACDILYHRPHRGAAFAAFAAQLVTGRTCRVGIRYYGGLAVGTTEPLVGAVLTGLFRHDALVDGVR